MLPSFGGSDPSCDTLCVRCVACVSTVCCHLLVARTHLVIRCVLDVLLV